MADSHQLSFQSYVLDTLESINQRLAELENSQAEDASSPEPETFPELTEYPSNAFAPPRVPVPNTGGPVAGPGPGYLPWRPKPEDLPDFMEFFLAHGAGRPEGVVLPHVPDEENPAKFNFIRPALHFTWRTYGPEYGSVQLIYPEPNDFKNPYQYEPFRVSMFRGDERAPEDWTGAPKLKMAQMIKGNGGRLPSRNVMFDVLEELSTQELYSSWHAYLFTNSTFRVGLIPNLLPEGTRLKITSEPGTRPEPAPEASGDEWQDYEEGNRRSGVYTPS